MNNSLMRRLDRVNNLLTRLEVFLLSLSTLVLVGVIFVQVICRYVLLIPTAWAEELARYLFVWTSYLGSAYALNEGGHIDGIFLQSKLSITLAQKVSFIKNKKKFIDGLEFIANIITLVFLLYFCFIWAEYLGIMSKSIQTSPTMHIPMFLVYSPVALGSVLMIFHGIYLLLCHITGTPLPKERKNTQSKEVDAV